MIGVLVNVNGVGVNVNGVGVNVIGVGVSGIDDVGESGNENDGEVKVICTSKRCKKNETQCAH